VQQGGQSGRSACLGLQGTPWKRKCNTNAARFQACTLFWGFHTKTSDSWGPAPRAGRSPGTSSSSAGRLHRSIGTQDGPPVPITAFADKPGAAGPLPEVGLPVPSRGCLCPSSNLS